MIIKVNSKKLIEGEKPVFDFESLAQITFELDQNFSTLSSSLYLAGSRVYKDSSKLLFLSTDYTINENKITFNVDTYTENYLEYVNDFKSSFNLELGANAASKTIFLLDKAFANPRVYIEGVPPGHLPDFYTKDETDAKFSTITSFDSLSGIVSGDIANLANNYWTKQETAAAISQIQTMKIVVVQELPPIEDAEEYTVYLVPSSSSTVSNVYDEYLVINHAWECIGSTAVDLSQYALLSGGNTFVGDQSINGFLTINPSSFNSISDIVLNAGNNLYFRSRFGRAEINCLVAGTDSYSQFNSQSNIVLGTKALNYDGRDMVCIGQGTRTGRRNGQTVFGRYGVSDNDHDFVIQCGTEENPKNLGFIEPSGITIDGNLTLSGILTAPSGNFDYITLSGSSVMPASGTVDELNVTVKDYMFHEVPINVMNRTNATLTFGDHQWIKGTYGHRTIVTGKQYVQLNCPYNNLTLSESSFSLGGGNVGDFFRFPIHGNNIEKVGPFDVRGSVRWTGDTIETVSGTIFDPGMNKVLKHTLAEGESLTINRSISQNALVGALRTTKQFDFEIHLIQPSTAVNFTFDNTVIWGDGINFSSQNPEPSMNQANTEYCIVIRWDGTDLLANLAYTKEITA